MISLYPYQQQMVEDIRSVYRRKFRAPLLVAPTGSGKTVLFCDMSMRHAEKKGRVLILVHRQELIEQVSETLDRFDVTHGVVGQERRFQDAAVMIGSVFTVIRRMARFSKPPTLIIVDEAHHAAASTTWGKVLAAFPQAHKLGVTATPIRLSGEGLADSFDTLIQGPTTQQLIDDGYLSRFRVFCPSSPDLSSVHKRVGDFVTKELEVAVDRPSLTGDAVDHYMRHAKDRQAVAFCVSVQHAKHVAEQFMAAGISAQSIDGSLPTEWRKGIVRDFREGRLKILTSCDLISEGFDVPNIACGISLRPTMSLGLWLQQFGRCLRTAQGKPDTIFLDHAGNALRHGLPTDEREWSLAGTRGTKRSDERIPSVRICKKCFAANKSTAQVCAQCGKAFDAKPREVSKKEGELEELTPEAMAALAERKKQGRAQSLEALTELGKLRGYKSPERWAEHIWQARNMKKQRKVS
jgi:DNA repair protein RadD